MLGGSSSINGMIFVRGNQKNFDDWAAEGCEGWGYQDVLPSYKRMESWEGGATSLQPPGFGWPGPGNPPEGPDRGLARLHRGPPRDRRGEEAAPIRRNVDPRST